MFSALFLHIGHAGQGLYKFLHSAVACCQSFGLPQQVLDSQVGLDPFLEQAQAGPGRIQRHATGKWGEVQGAGCSNSFQGLLWGQDAVFAFRDQLLQVAGL